MEGTEGMGGMEGTKATRSVLTTVMLARRSNRRGECGYKGIGSGKMLRAGHWAVSGLRVLFRHRLARRPKGQEGLLSQPGRRKAAARNLEAVPASEAVAVPADMPIAREAIGRRRPLYRAASQPIRL